MIRVKKTKSVFVCMYEVCMQVVVECIMYRIQSYGGNTEYVLGVNIVLTQH